MTQPPARRVEPLLRLRLLCRLGLHAWRPLPLATRPLRMRCHRCNKDGWIT